MPSRHSGQGHASVRFLPIAVDSYSPLCLFICQRSRHPCRSQARGLADFRKPRRLRSAPAIPLQNAEFRIKSEAATSFCHSRGGADGIRTHDLLVANQALSQLSYGPPSELRIANCGLKNKGRRPRRPFAVQSEVRNRSLVGPGGFEPPTSPLSGARSSQLSYEPSTARNVEFGMRSELHRRNQPVRRRSLRPPHSALLTGKGRAEQFEPQQSGSVLTSHPLGDAI